MRKAFTKHSKIFLLAAFILVFSTVLLYAYSGGITGRTLKTSTAGCSCHSPTQTNDVIVLILGADTVTRGTTTQYILSISRQSKTGAGLDIATRNGTLGVIGSLTHTANGEITNSSNIPLVAGTIAVPFNYTAPNAVTIDTIWATGLATNSDNTTSGDDWNWAPSKRIIVRDPIGIKPISNEVPATYGLNQNYPNPFNPTTSIEFAIPKASFVSLVVYDMTGKVVENLVNESLGAGNYKVSWNAGQSASGLYFYKLTAGNYSDTKKMMLVK